MVSPVTAAITGTNVEFIIEHVATYDGVRSEDNARISVPVSGISSGQVGRVRYKSEWGTALEQDLKGDWIVVKDRVFDSKSEVEPSLRRLTFETNALVRWYYEIGGKTVEHVGCYEIQRSKNPQQAVVIITESDKGDSLLSVNPIAFIIQDVTVDFDSRVNKDSVGKVLKFSHRDGKCYVFTRKQ